MCVTLFFLFLFFSSLSLFLFLHTLTLHPLFLSTLSLGITPLHFASGKGSVECIRFLIEHGALIDIQDNKGMTPLHFAAKKQVRGGRGVRGGVKRMKK
jgi:hypothetical protein